MRSRSYSRRLFIHSHPRHYILPQKAFKQYTVRRISHFYKHTHISSKTKRKKKKDQNFKLTGLTALPPIHTSRPKCVYRNKYKYPRRRPLQCELRGCFFLNNPSPALARTQPTPPPPKKQTIPLSLSLFAKSSPISRVHTRLVNRARARAAAKRNTLACAAAAAAMRCAHPMNIYSLSR